MCFHCSFNTTLVNDVVITVLLLYFDIYGSYVALGLGLEAHTRVRVPAEPSCV